MTRTTRWPVLGALSISVLAAASAHGAPVDSNSFSEDLGAFSLSPGTGALISHSSTVGGGSLQISDTDSTFAKATLNFDQATTPFNTANASDGTIVFSFDIRVDSFTNPNTASAANPRVTIRHGSADFVTVGFGRATGYNGYTSQTRNLFYIGTSAGTTVPTDTTLSTAAQAIGLASPGTDGSTFLTGFDFGAYDSTTDTNNDSSIATNGDGSFIRVELTYVNGASTISCHVMNLATNDAVTQVFTVSPGSFSNVSTDQLVISSGSSGTADFYLDNINIVTVPEPTTAGMVMGAAAVLPWFWRRR